MMRGFLILAMVASPAFAARTSLGTFDGWGAFKDENPMRCYAIAQPVRGGGGKWQPFASVATWPRVACAARFIFVSAARNWPVPR